MISVQRRADFRTRPQEIVDYLLEAIDDELRRKERIDFPLPEGLSCEVREEVIKRLRTELEMGGWVLHGDMTFTIFSITAKEKS